ncbi:unnamed protein product [Prunus armeniaca]|uniref:laccase n=1 Tax=Prunus armeniaca TaxID=36596 RepID=A0A6J5XS46_PRUAR|nr:unnamed protein product [Prunus armeniaca]
MTGLADQIVSAGISDYSSSTGEWGMQSQVLVQKKMLLRWERRSGETIFDQHKSMALRKAQTFGHVVTQNRVNYNVPQQFMEAAQPCLLDEALPFHSEARGSLFPKRLNKNSPKRSKNNHKSDIKETPRKLTTIPALSQSKAMRSPYQYFAYKLPEQTLLWVAVSLLWVSGLHHFSSRSCHKEIPIDVQVKNVSRLCHAKPIVTINGRFPGPTIYVREGDRVLINVTNHAQYNMSIHWHGLKQYRNGWADGPAYVTQCPIQTGSSYTYDFNVTGQRGTLWWHAHILWLRATVYGAIVILPKQGTPFPFPQPYREAEIILGEWWNGNVEEFVNKANNLGLPPNSSDAHTINGKPGPLFPCYEKHTFVMEVEQGKTYLLRIINAALNDELFFGIAGHNLTVVETTNVLVQANQASGRYFIAARPFMDAPVAIDNKTATGIFHTEASPTHNVPLKVDRKLFYTIGFGKESCPTCLNGTRFVASLNNISFEMPQVGLLQAHYFNLKGVFKTDFPDRPQTPFNYTGAPLTANLGTSTGTRLSKIAFNSTVELVLQDTNLLTVESHPFHLHGYNFFVVGTGIGNFDPAKDPAKYNLVDPVERNTVGVPTGGWTAIRFRADNPGVWFMHCPFGAFIPGGD